MMLRIVIAFACTGYCFQASNHCVAQSPAEAGRRALDRQRFPWFDSQSETVSGLSHKDAGRAKSLNRGEVAPHMSRAASANSNTKPKPANNAWTPLFETLAWVLIGILFALIVATIIWVFLKMEAGDNDSQAEGESEDPEAARKRIRQLPFEMQPDFRGDFRTMAERYASEGQYGFATMMLFSHVLVLLDQKGLIRLKKGKTNRQYLGELESHDGLVSYYQRVMVPFEESFFGDHSINQPSFESCWNDLDQFHRDVNQSEQVVLP